MSRGWCTKQPKLSPRVPAYPCSRLLTPTAASDARPWTLLDSPNNFSWLPLFSEFNLTFFSLTAPDDDMAARHPKQQRKPFNDQPAQPQPNSRLVLPWPR